MTATFTVRLDQSPLQLAVYFSASFKRNVISAVENVVHGNGKHPARQPFITSGIKKFARLCRNKRQMPIGRKLDLAYSLLTERQEVN
jgi:hypothetical protein